MFSHQLYVVRLQVNFVYLYHFYDCISIVIFLSQALPSINYFEAEKGVLFAIAWNAKILTNQSGIISNQQSFVKTIETSDMINADQKESSFRSSKNQLDQIKDQNKNQSLHDRKDF